MYDKFHPAPDQIPPREFGGIYVFHPGIGLKIPPKDGRKFPLRDW
jgi:hypothetical protein